MSSTDAFVQSIQDAVEQLRATINDPLDQIRLLVQLASFSQAVVAGDTVTQPTAATCRRAALVSLANAVSDYQPSSSTEAEGILALVVPVFADEIRYAADAGDSLTYHALRTLRAAVVTDLQTRGSQLPEVITVSLKASQPSLVVAWNLYADANREVELVQRNPDVVHPAFMPVSFEALSD